MTPFLKGVADAYLKVPSHLLQHYCFLFPNKRSAAFFQKYLAEGLNPGETILAPRIVTIDDFVQRLSGLTVDSHLNLLFSLYNTYLSLLKEGAIHNPDEPLDGEQPGDAASAKIEAEKKNPQPDFDSFIRWGETVLNDFNDVDLFCVNREEVFRNVKDFKTISADYLTDAQREVMRVYFNFEPSPADAAHFWEHYPEKENKGAGRFRRLWETLGPLYKAFSETLRSKGLATRGMATRIAMQNVKEKGRELLKFKKLVIVGFNVLTVAEYMLFEELKKLKCDEVFVIEDCDSLADFFWDATGPVLSPSPTAESADGYDPDNSASRFVRHNIRKFPAPKWALPSLMATNVETLPEVLESIGAPSNAMQAKIAAEILRKDIAPELPVVVKDDTQAPDFSKANVAIVLPDEGLLFPLLYSIPHNYDINLTMGYPLRQTAALSFVNLLRKLLAKRRTRIDEKLVVYKPDLSAFLSHPFVQTVGGVEAVRALNDYLAGLRQSEVSLDDVENKLCTKGEEKDSRLMKLLRLVLSLPKDSSGHSDSSVDAVEKVFNHILAIIKHIKTGILSAVRSSAKNDGEQKETLAKARMDMAHLDVYLDALCQLLDTVITHKIPMRESTALFLADRLIGAEKVEFEGEPLTGLQVMGMLETRGLDFEYLIIPSLNERIFPRRARARSFIPDVLRRAYGMPPSNYQESLFSYYFYRMISRARKVWMIHDARLSTGGVNGEPSRYLSQLRYLYAPGHLVERESSFEIPEKSFVKFEIEKSAEIMKVLDTFKRRNPDPAGPDNSESPRNFSASTLKNYLKCPVKFYFQNIAGFGETDTLTEDIDAISMGNIFHTVMESLYPKAAPDSPKVVTESMIENLLSDPKQLLESVRRAIIKVHFHVSDENESERMLSEGGMPGGVEMVAKGIAENVMKVLRHDLELAPFKILGSELKETFAFPVTSADGKESFMVNLKFAIDRLDQVVVDEKKIVNGDSKASAVKAERLRIVDYKTGKAHVEAETFRDIFMGVVDASNIFQLMLYARMLGLWHKHKSPLPIVPVEASSEESASPIPDPAMEIYEVETISSKSRKIPEIAKEKIYVYSQIENDFQQSLDALLTEIFNPEVPFRQTDNVSDCSFCHLRSLCRR